VLPREELHTGWLIACDRVLQASGRRDRDDRFRGCDEHALRRVVDPARSV